VIDVETPSEEPRLVVEGLIRVDVSEPFLPVRIKVSLTDNFFSEIPVTSLENILISYQEIEDGVVSFSGSSTLAEIAPGTGIYEPDPNFMDDQRIPTVVTFAEETVFNLLIRHQGRSYFAETRYVASVPIISVQQGNGKFFSDEDTELIVLFADQPNTVNNYLFDFSFNEYLVTKDEFYKDQLFQFSYFYDRQFEPGTEIEISLLGADQNFYNYMDLLIEQSEESQGVFQTPVSTVRGNIIDITDLDNNQVVDNVGRPDIFPLGYFAVVQENKQSVTIR
jgi:hypothetical protein